MKIKLTRIFLTLLVVAFVLSCSGKSKKVEKLGNEIALKLEEYYEANGYYPLSLASVNYTVTMEGPIFYERLDSFQYTLWYGKELGESWVYNKETQSWE